MNDAVRQIPDTLGIASGKRLKSWETLLLAVGVAIFIINSPASLYFLKACNLFDATFNFTEKAMIAFAMAMLEAASGKQVIAETGSTSGTSMGVASLANGEIPKAIFPHRVQISASMDIYAALWRERVQ